MELRTRVRYWLKALGLKKTLEGGYPMYEGYPFYKVKATIIKLAPDAYRVVILDGTDEAHKGDIYWTKTTLYEALLTVHAYGQGMGMVRANEVYTEVLAA